VFEKLIKDLEDLQGTEIQIRATGEYPTSRRTKVADVAVYQNNGTETIKPARFVQKAAGKHHAWQGIIFRSIGKILFKNDNIRQALDDMGLKVSEDISRVCNRIRTGRLKKSFLPTIRRKARFRFPTS